MGRFSGRSRCHRNLDTRGRRRTGGGDGTAVTEPKPQDLNSNGGTVIQEGCDWRPIFIYIHDTREGSRRR